MSLKNHLISKSCIILLYELNNAVPEHGMQYTYALYNTQIGAANC